MRREIEAQLERFEDVSDGGSPDGNGRRRSQGNAPRFDIRTHLYRMTGVDLTRIDGVDGTALKVISEIGTRARIDITGGKVKVPRLL